MFRQPATSGLREARRFLDKFQEHLGDWPPTAALAIAFLAQYKGRRINSWRRCVSVIKGFMEWYGEPLDMKPPAPQMLPDYVESGDIDKLEEAMAARRTHRRKAKERRQLGDSWLPTA